MNILFVLENYYPHIGGLESVFQDLAEGLAARGHHIRVVTRLISGTVHFEVVHGVHIYRVSCFDSRYWFTFMSIPAVLTHARWADVVHTTTYNGAPPAWLACRVLGKPVLITVHEVLGSRWKLFSTNFIFASIHRALEWAILRLGYDLYVPVSESTRRQLELIGIRARTQTIYNGLDYSFWNCHVRVPLCISSSMRGRWTALFYGRPGKSKGLDVLIRAIPAVLEKIPQFHLLCILSQDSAYRKQAASIRMLAKKLGVSSAITFMDPVARKELPMYLRAVDCVVVPSLSEGFGFTVAESCAMDKITIASAIDSIPEIISGRFNLFSCGEAALLASHLILAYNGAFQHTPLKKFHLEDNIKNYLNAYQKLLPT